MNVSNLEFSFEREIQGEDLHRLMIQSTWGNRRTVTGLGKMLQHSTLKLGVWEGEKLVGFARAFSYGAYRSLIEDVIVDEAYRGKGIGTKIMQLMIEKLSKVDEIYLFCGENRETYYHRFGFSLTPHLSMRLCP